MAARPIIQPTTSGARKTAVLQDATLPDDLTGGQYKVQHPYKFRPEPDPNPSSLAEYLSDTPHRVHTLERVLHADMGDPELPVGPTGAIDLPPYVRVPPRGVSLGAFPAVSEIVLHNKHGNVIVGKTAFRNPAEQISWGGICSFNPQVMNCIPSTIATPIPTFLFSLRVPPVTRAALDSEQGRQAQEAQARPAPEPSDAPLRDYKVTMETGKQIVVQGAANPTHAAARAMEEARAAGTARRPVAVQEVSAAEGVPPGMFVLPAQGRVSSEFGNREHPVLGGTRFHKGLDIAAPAGSPVAASAAGTVKEIGYSSSYGNYVIINHGDNYETLYAHLQSSSVTEGQAVTQGAAIGAVGSTGRSTGPHLHFEVRDLAGNVINPRDVLGG